MAGRGADEGGPAAGRPRAARAPPGHPALAAIAASGSRAWAPRAWAWACRLRSLLLRRPAPAPARGFHHGRSPGAAGGGGCWYWGAAAAAAGTAGRLLASWGGCIPAGRRRRLTLSTKRAGRASDDRSIRAATISPGFAGARKRRGTRLSKHRSPRRSGYQARARCPRDGGRARPRCPERTTRGTCLAPLHGRPPAAAEARRRGRKAPSLIILQVPVHAPEDRRGRSSWSDPGPMKPASSVPNDRTAGW